MYTHYTQAAALYLRALRDLDAVRVTVFVRVTLWVRVLLLEMVRVDVGVGALVLVAERDRDALTARKRAWDRCRESERP